MNATAKEILLVKKGNKFLCRILIEVSIYCEESEIIGINGLVVISLLDKDPVKGMFYNYHIPLTFTKPGPWRLHTAGDFSIPLTIRGLGVARLIWHKIYQLLPNSVRENVIIAGELSPVDSKPINGPRRDRLWMDVAGYSNGHPNATFKPQIDNEPGQFYGFLHDPWDEKKSILNWSIL